METEAQRKYSSRKGKRQKDINQHHNDHKATTNRIWYQVVPTAGIPLGEQSKSHSIVRFYSEFIPSLFRVYSDYNSQNQRYQKYQPRFF